MSINVTIESKAILKHEPMEAFERLHKNVHHLDCVLPPVDHIESVKTHDRGDEVVSKNRWTIGQSYIPGPLKNFLNLEDLECSTYVIWDKNNVRNEWASEITAFSFADVLGTVEFYTNNGNSYIEIGFDVTADSIPMVPTFLDSTAQSIVKSTVQAAFDSAITTIAQNLEELPQTRYDHKNEEHKNI